MNGLNTESKDQSTIDTLIDEIKQPLDINTL
ncbi:hypothetical protein SAMN05421788_104192 [Filimonas lacunae]|uniref:Uncharacterized protein n=1 Tax=Filimonas lacunae TaxID=477680 RepID=A0A1N7PYU2_9BACT|nr:hypothetical protein SAMN05421788_104192 [Filimonas lacunae]